MYLYYKQMLVDSHVQLRGFGPYGIFMTTCVDIFLSFSMGSLLVFCKISVNSRFEYRLTPRRHLSFNRQNTTLLKHTNIFHCPWIICFGAIVPSSDPRVFTRI
jgi:hypothetical protein